MRLFLGLDSRIAEADDDTRDLLIPVRDVVLRFGDPFFYDAES